MRVFIDCQCLLLSRALELFCAEFISTKAECDFIISDRKLKSSKPVFFISKDSAHMSVPFTRAVLMDGLWEFYSVIHSSPKPSVSSELERSISQLCDKFKADLIALLKDRR